ncbi:MULTISPECIES: PAS domain-containing protein [Ramlibacter]|uniref:PAS domain S-box protein n=1 Tax=Ramlibacter pinisoli TaxID=2682844 RepID=A0A6N8IWT1_9BURK|nr:MULTISPECIES: PAS domain-containing protein [Ramlibacter]MBA2961490.1 PAS domain S-box protein [Ramlibacter sp. CGMCC 1.13660]MVQ31434.1 PAS domain S-box protein [Ramlibacter pinisoli]
MQGTVDYKQLVEVIGDGVVVCDPKGVITYWNAAATRIFGFSEQEALGQSLDLIIPERQRQRHWDGYDKTMATGLTRYGNDVLRVPALHKEGRPLSIAFTVALLRDAAGQVAAIVAAVRDESARFAEDRNLRKRLTELEMQVRGTGGPAQP